MSDQPIYQHTETTRAILRTFVPIACPPEVIELNLVDDVIDHLALSMSALPFLIRNGLVAGMLGFDAAAALVPKHRGKRFRFLKSEQQEAYFLAWKKSNVAVQHEFIKGLKGLLCLAYYDLPVIKARIDYHPDRWVEKVTKRRHENFAAAIQKQAEDILAPDPLPTNLARDLDEQSEAV